jgi:hypothetical protein
VTQDWSLPEPGADHALSSGPGHPRSPKFRLLAVTVCPRRLLCPLPQPMPLQTQDSLATSVLPEMTVPTWAHTAQSWQWGLAQSGPLLSTTCHDCHWTLVTQLPVCFLSVPRPAGTQ